MKAKGTHVGHCQVCGRVQVVESGGVLAKHGYEVKGWGYFAGTCKGSGFGPLELSLTRYTLHMELVRQYAEEALLKAAGYGNGSQHPACVNKRDVHGCTVMKKLHPEQRFSERVPVSVAWQEASKSEKEKGLALAIHGLEAEAKEARAHIVYMKGVKDKVHGKPLQPRAATEKAPIKVGDTLHLFGKDGYDVIVKRIEDRVCRGCGPYMNGHCLPHIVWDSQNGERAYPVRLIRR